MEISGKLHAHPTLPKGNRPRYPLCRPQGLYGRCGKEKIVAPRGNRTPVVQKHSAYLNVNFWNLYTGKNAVRFAVRISRWRVYGYTASQPRTYAEHFRCSLSFMQCIATGLRDAIIMASFDVWNCMQNSYSTSILNWFCRHMLRNYQGLHFFLFGLWGYWHCGHSWPIVPASGDSEDVCGEADAM
jgi:hypothetical protein